MSISSLRFGKVDSGRGNVSPKLEEQFRLTTRLGELGNSAIAQKLGIPENVLTKLGTSGTLSQFGDRLRELNVIA